MPHNAGKPHIMWLVRQRDAFQSDIDLSCVPVCVIRQYAVNILYNDGSSLTFGKCLRRRPQVPYTDEMAGMRILHKLFAGWKHLSVYGSSAFFRCRCGLHNWRRGNVAWMQRPKILWMMIPIRYVGQAALQTKMAGTSPGHFLVNPTISSLQHSSWQVHWPMKFRSVANLSRFWQSHP